MTVAARPAPRWPARRMPTLALVAIAALLVSSTGVSGQEPSPSSASSATSSPSPSAAAQAPAWARGRVPAGEAGIEMKDVVAGGPGFVAVGGGFIDGSERPLAAVWVSEDGAAWQDVPLLDEARFGDMRSVTAFTGGFLAVGSECCPDRIAMWLSPDGVSWERLPTLPNFEGAALQAVTSTPEGVTAVGCVAVLECGAGIAMSSLDGRSWSDPVVLPLVPLGIASTSEGLLAVGTTETYEGSPATALSTDGTRWSLDAFTGVGSLESAAETAAGSIVVGGSTEIVTGAVTGLFLQAGVDEELTSLTSPRLRDAWIEDVIVDGEGLLLVGWRLVREGTIPMSLRTTDLRRLRAIRLEKGSGGPGIMYSVAVHPDGRGAVAVGSRVSARGQVPAAWWIGARAD